MATTVTQFKEQNPYWGQSFDRLAWLKEQEAKRPKQEQPKSKKGSGNQSWLSSIISELSGAGGAAGGAAAGAALGSVVPGIGNIVGAIGGGIAGGFLGGTGGRLVENQIRDNEMRLVDALKEGAWSGAFGAVGPTWQAARGLGALGKAGGQAGIRGGASILSGMSDDAAKVAGKAIAKSGAKAGKAIGQGITNLDDLAYATQKGMQSAGGKLRAVNRGIVAGNSGLSPDDVVRQNKALDSVNKWFSGVGKSQQYTNADDAMKALSNTYKASGEGAKAFGKNADDVVARFITNIDGNDMLRGTLSPKYQRVVSNLADDVTKIKTNGDFVDFMAKKINPLYKELKNGNPGSVQTQIYEAFRQAGKSVIDENMVTRSGINKQFANLMGATESLGKTITRDVGAGAGQGLTLGRMLGNVAGGGMDTVGRGMQQVGKVSRYTTPVLTGAAARGAVNGGEPVAQGEQVDPIQQEIEALQSSMVYNQPGQYGLDQALGGLDMPQQQSNNPFSAANAQSAVAQILAQGGDFKDVKDYLAIVETMSALGGSGGDGDLTAIQRNKIAGYNTANQVVNSLEQLWQNVNQPNNQALASASGLPGVKQIRSGVDPNVRQYTQFAEGTLAPIIKSLGETGVLTDRDIIRAYGLVPNLQDSPDVASQKIVQLRQLLSDAESATRGGNYGSGDDLSSLLQSYQPY